MKMKLASDPLPNRVPVGKGDSLRTGRRLQEPSPGGHNPRQYCLPGDPAIRQSRPRGSSVLAWGKDHLPLKGILSKDRCQLPLDTDGHSTILDPWEATSIGRRPPEYSTCEKATEQPSSRIHLSRSNDRLKPCDCPSQGPLCAIPSVTTTITGGDVDAAAQKTTLGSKIMEWANGLEKQAVTIIHDPYTLSFNAFTAIPSSNTSQTDLYLNKGSGVHCRSSTTTSSLDETVMTIQYSSTITTKDERLPGTINKRLPRKPVASQPSKTGSNSTSSLRSSPEREKRNRIEQLESRRRYLTRRRESIEKALYKLMWHSRPYSTPDFMKASEEVKKTTVRLHSDLADVRRAEHDIGLQLFLALKNMDERDYCGAGGTSLWVSRVTR
ncbi:hypothetical protein BDW62DRAFT_220592 [Aspergillus aurantiobrunneus]